MKKLFIATSLSLLLTACLSDVQDEVNSNQAVKNLRVSFNSFGVDSITQPADENAQLSNYKLHLSMALDIENTGSDNAKSQGIESETAIDTISEPSISLPFEPFEVPGDESKVETANTELNFETHRRTVKYILNQYINENPIQSEIGLNLLYDVGATDGSISLPKLNQAIPTQGQLPETTRNKMSQILDFGILDD